MTDDGSDRADWLLSHPLERPGDVSDYREVAVQRDGALLTTVLAVDR